MSENRNSFIEATKAKDERLEALKQLYPELFADGKLNIDVLKEITGGENPQEERTPGYYGLYWPGKRKAKIEAKASPKGTLVPVPGDGVNEDTTHNIYIEGDNLEVLRILKQSYKGRVKMIYIDPPYNTGNDFIYPDDYTMPVEEYKRLTGQTDEKGNVLTTNLKSNGAFHSDWLNMMYPRLQIARELLAEDGLIFISIDDNEQANLKLLCDDVFGEENFVSDIVWKNKYGAGAYTVGFISVHEYILCYSKTPITDITSELDEEGQKSYNKKDEKFPIRGGYMTQPLMTNSLGDRPNLMYTIEYNGTTIKPRKQWVWEKERLERAIANNEVEFNLQKDGTYSVRSKSYLKDENGILRRGKPLSLMNGPFNQDGTKDIRALFEDKSIFDFTKPSELIKKFISLQVNNESDNEEIIMDFFSGSATTAQAVMQLNNEDQGKRKFIMIQLPQKCEDKSEAAKAGYSNICEIGKERIRRAGAKILEEAKANKDMFSEENPLDIGFKVFRMQESNFNEYTPVQGQDENATKSLFEELENNQIPLVEGWKTENVLTEIILKQGFALDCDCKKVDAFTKNTVYCIKDSEGPASRTTTMYVCLDSQIDSDTIKNLKLDEKEKFICLNSAIDDTSYARLADKGRIETI